jgi:hypothetical protein
MAAKKRRCSVLTRETLMKTLLIALALSSLAAAASAAPRVCPQGMQKATTAELFFGRDIGETLGVTDSDWRQFVDEEVSPRFAAGLSVNDVYGQWRGPKGTFVREPTKALFLVLAGTADERANLGFIRAAYKRRFHQDSVLLVEEEACVSF